MGGEPVEGGHLFATHELKKTKVVVAIVAESDSFMEFSCAENRTDLVHRLPFLLALRAMMVVREEWTCVHACATSKRL